MDRVRNLVRRNGGSRTHERAVAPILHDPIDSDQATLVESNAEDDRRSQENILGRRNSETSTIGDLRRSGFVNRCPVFQDTRDVLFASTVMGKGFYAFPSKESFQEFRKHKRRLDELRDDQALGFPMLHTVPLNVFRTMLNRNLPIMRIHRFVLVDTSTPGAADKYPEDENCTLLARRGSLCVFKVHFCEVFQRIYSDSSCSEYKMTFRLDNRSDNSLFTTKMARHFQRRATDARINDLNLRWTGTSQLTSPFGSGNFKLVVLDDGLPSFLDEVAEGSHSPPTRPVSSARNTQQMPVWGIYSDESATFIPKNRTLKIADFKINELSTCSPGLSDVPWETLVLTSMCMVLHDFEARKDRRSINGIAGVNIAL